MIIFFNIRYLLVFLVLLTSNIQANTLHLYFVDVNNLKSFNMAVGDIEIKRKDKFIVFDSENSQYIFEKKVLTSSETRRYNDNKHFLDFIYTKLDTHLKVKEKNIKNKKELFAINSQKNDFARQLKTVKNFIKIYEDDYSDIKVIFFGDSYLHNAYNHDFNSGVPSDGFIYMDKSEFNTFEDIKTQNVEFAIFYDTEPYSPAPKMFRFYKKLFSKKFSANFSSFNKNATFNSKPTLLDVNKTFFPKLIKVIGEAHVDDCGELDKINTNINSNIAKYEIEVLNSSCRKNSMISFSHNGQKKQITADGDGRAKISFKQIAGHKNIIKYINLNGKWEEIINEYVAFIQDSLIFDLDISTSVVTIKGRNPLREEDSQFIIWYKNTGAKYNLKVKNGEFNKTISIESGENIFKWKDMEGVEHEKIITVDTKCTDKVSYDKNISKEYGIMNVILENSCREDGTYAIFKYEGDIYKSIMLNGKTGKTIILKNDVNDVYYEDLDGNTKKLGTIEIRDFNDLIRFMISYKDNVIILEHIYETNIKPNQPVMSIDYKNRKLDKDGHLHHSNAKSSRGEIFINETPSYSDYLVTDFIKTYKQIYISRKTQQGKGKVSFYVDYFSRHGTFHSPKGTHIKEAPLCGNRSLGGVVVNYEILYDGSTQSGKRFLNPSKCKNQKPTTDDNKLILIKEVIIE